MTKPLTHFVLSNAHQSLGYAKTVHLSKSLTGLVWPTIAKLLKENNIQGKVLIDVRELSSNHFNDNLFYETHLDGRKLSPFKKSIADASALLNLSIEHMASKGRK